MTRLSTLLTKLISSYASFIFALPRRRDNFGGPCGDSIRRYETQINANNQIFIQVGTRHFGLVDRAVLTAPGVTVPCFLLHFDVHDSTVRY